MKPGDVNYSDGCGPFPITILGGGRYFDDAHYGYLEVCVVPKEESGQG